MKSQRATKKGIKLGIKPIVQEPNECAPAALLMILDFFGFKHDLKNITKTVPHDSQKWRDWLYWMGVFAQKQKIKTEIVTLSTQTFDVSWNTLGPTAILGKIKKELQFAQKNKKSQKEPYPYYFTEHQLDTEIPELKAAQSFIEHGGKIRIEPLTSELMESELGKKNPIIASLDATILYRTKRGVKEKAQDVQGSTWGHVVVIEGYDKDSFFVVDPANWYEKSQKFAVPKEYVTESVTRRDQNILIIKNPKQ